MKIHGLLRMQEDSSGILPVMVYLFVCLFALFKDRNPTCECLSRKQREGYTYIYRERESGLGNNEDSWRFLKDPDDS